MLAFYDEVRYPRLLWAVRRLVSSLGWASVVTLLTFIGILIKEGSAVQVDGVITAAAVTLVGDSVAFIGLFVLYGITDTVWRWSVGLWHLWLARHDRTALRQQWPLWVAMIISLAGMIWLVINLASLVMQMNAMRM